MQEGPDWSFIERAANVLYDLIKTSITAEKRNQAENGQSRNTMTSQTLTDASDLYSECAFEER